MTRTKKIAYIKEVFPGLYEDLSKKMQNLIDNPNEATLEEINLYNKEVSEYLSRRFFSPVIEFTLRF